MKTIEFTEFLVKSVVKNVEDVSVKEFETEDGMQISVFVNKDDMKFVIGKDGKVANSIRMLVKMSTYTHGNTKVKINFDSI